MLICIWIDGLLDWGAGKMGRPHRMAPRRPKLERALCYRAWPVLNWSVYRLSAPKVWNCGYSVLYDVATTEDHLGCSVSSV